MDADTLLLTFCGIILAVAIALGGYAAGRDAAIRDLRNMGIDPDEDLF